MTRIHFTKDELLLWKKQRDTIAKELATVKAAGKPCPK